jgi:hypothetical protein
MSLPPLIAAVIDAPANQTHALRLADAALTMHTALERVAELWGPCPAGDDGQPIFTAGAEFGTLADLRAVERGLRAVGG